MRWAYALFVPVLGLAARAWHGEGAAAPTEKAPVILIAEAASLDAAHAKIALPIDPRPLADEERSAALALATMPASEIDRLDAALAAFVERLELKRNPLVDDLEDDDPLAGLVELIATDAPALAASYGLASRRVVSGDKRTVYALARSCDEGRGSDPSVVCVPAWTASKTPDPDAKRARFFAWSVAHAASITVDDPASFTRLQAALRDATTRRDHAVALVVTAADLVGRNEAHADSVRAHATRALELLGDETPAPNSARGKQLKLLRVLAHRPEEGRSLVPWLEIGPRAMLVVPSIASLARVDDFVGEITKTAAATGATVRWNHRPSGL